MLWLRTWQLATKSLLLHPLRSLLTVLGILIGVWSVISLVAISRGVSNAAQEQVKGLGARNIIVRTMKPPAEATAGFSGPIPYGITRTDFRKLETIPTVQSALPIREIRRQFRFGDRTVDGKLVGCTPDYAEVTHLDIDRGRFLTEADLIHKNVHCVLAQEMANELFPYEDPIGRRVYLPEHKDYYIVVGVLKHRGATGAIGGSLDARDFSYDVYIPIDTLQQRIGDLIVTRGSGSFQAEEVQLTQVTLRFEDTADVKRTAPLVEAILADQHQGKSDVSVVVPQELIEQAESQAVMFDIFMALLAVISLVVGGIGIMNIMLATVTERTREIGIRRALGARRSDIVHQFLVETVLLSSGGGLIGVLFGLAGPWMINKLREFVGYVDPERLENLPDIVKQVEPVIVPEWVAGAFLISVLVGVIFGIYPAIRAARMDPIEALRHE